MLLHECLHLAVHVHHGGPSGPTSHNSPEWVAELNRVAPLLGFPNFVAGLSTPRRVAAPETGAGDGRRRTVVERRSDTSWGGEPLGFRAVAGFPHALRIQLSQTKIYETNAIPFPDALDGRFG